MNPYNPKINFGNVGNYSSASLELALQELTRQEARHKQGDEAGSEQARKSNSLQISVDSINDELYTREHAEVCFKVALLKCLQAIASKTILSTNGNEAVEMAVKWLLM